MNDLKKWARIEQADFEKGLRNRSVVTQYERKEQIAAKLHQLKLFFLYPWIIIIATLIIVALLCGAFNVYFWKKDPVWITVINIILQSGLPALFTFLITNHFKNKNENPE